MLNDSPSLWWLKHVENQRFTICYHHSLIHMGMGQNPVPLVNPKIAGKWMFIPLKMVLIGIDPYPYQQGHVMKLWQPSTAFPCWQLPVKIPSGGNDSHGCNSKPGRPHPIWLPPAVLRDLWGPKWVLKKAVNKWFLWCCFNNFWNFWNHRFLTSCMISIDFWACRSRHFAGHQR